MKHLSSRAELLRELAALQGRTLALVPTMGFLHEGHLSLIREGKKRAELVAVTIFVNPTQFGPNEDLARYPRDLPGDLRKCEEAGADLVWAPPPEDVYRPGYQTSVDVRDLGSVLDGVHRPGHFRGVATVVNKLFTLFRPQVALFGEKDYQQLQVIKRMARDLDVDAWTEIVGMPTVREPDGLAMSSRNAYLSPAERVRALSLSRALAATEAAVKAGERSTEKLERIARDTLDADRIDDATIVDAETLLPVPTIERPAVLLLAAFVGKTRLIDNRVLAP